MASPGSEEEDEDLKHAIALSLGQEYVPSYRWQKRKASPLEGPPTKSRRDAAPSDKDDADLKSATAISLLMGVHAGPSSLGQEFKHPLHQVARGPCKFPGQIDFGAPKRIEDDMDSRNRKLGSGIGSSQSSQFHVDDSLRSKDTLGTKPATRSAPLAQPSVPKSSPTEANAELPNSAKFADENEEGDEDLKKAIALSLGHDISADCSPTILEASHKDSPVLGHSSTKRGTDPNQSIVEREKLKANPVPCVSPGAPYKSFSRSSLLSSFPPLSSVPSDQHQFVREARLRHFHNEGKDIQQEKMAGRQPPSDPGHNYAYPIMGMQRFFGQTGGLPAHARTGNANPAANTFNTANRIASGNQENVNIAQQQGLGRQYNDNAAIPQGNNFLAEYHSLGQPQPSHKQRYPADQNGPGITLSDADPGFQSHASPLAGVGNVSGPSVGPSGPANSMDRAYFGQSTTGGHSSHALSQGGPPVEENYVHLGPGVQNHFWSGALKRTWIYNFQRLGDDIRLEEVLKARDLETAYLCSYEFDAPWLFSKLELSRTKLFLVMHADNEQKHFYRQECKSLGLDVTPIFPPARSGNMTSMHSKLMILKYIGSVRIVVPTGNLQPADWGETGHMENMVFIIDLPRNEAMAPPTPVEHLPIFGQELLRFVDALGLDSSAQNMLRRHNWHNTRPFGFVHSIPGTHNGTNMYKTGMPLLNNLVQQLGLGAYDNQRILSSWVDYMTSSLGRLKEDYVANFYRALQGEFDASNQPRTGRKMTKPEREYRKKLHERFHIVYPCNKTVQESIGGSGGAGTICLAHDYWIDDDFPKKLMHDLKSVRRGVLNHAKMILVRTHVSTGLSVHEFTMKCWAFVGSHNFSESAWGKTQRMRGSDDENRHKLIVRNYECGVIVPVGPDTIASYTWPALGEDEFVILEDEVPGYDIFLGSIPIPAAMPPERYNRYNQPGGRVTSRKVPFTFNPEQNPTTDVVPVDNETEAESSEEDGEEDDEL